MKLRSLLFVPGDQPERMAKAMAGAADALILDLEDSVAPAVKPEARRAVREFLAGAQVARSKPIFVRVNPLDPDRGPGQVAGWPTRISTRSCPAIRTASCCPRRKAASRSPS